MHFSGPNRPFLSGKIANENQNRNRGKFEGSSKPNVLARSGCAEYVVEQVPSLARGLSGAFSRHIAK